MKTISEAKRKFENWSLNCHGLFVRLLAHRFILVSCSQLLIFFSVHPSL